jgi:hypothetical protein
VLSGHHISVQGGSGAPQVEAASRQLSESIHIHCLSCEQKPVTTFVMQDTDQMADEEPLPPDDRLTASESEKEKTPAEASTSTNRRKAKSCTPLRSSVVLLRGHHEGNCHGSLLGLGEYYKAVLSIVSSRQSKPPPTRSEYVDVGVE